MQDLKIWEDKIKEKRKKTPWRKFVKEIASFTPIVFYKNDSLISKFPPGDRQKISSTLEFYSNQDRLCDFGINYDFSKSFFDNYKILSSNIKLPNIFHYSVNENCDFTEVAFNSKDSYLSNIIGYSENILYSYRAIRSRNILNSINVLDDSETAYFSRGVVNSLNIFYSNYIKNCNNIWFSSNLIGCNECLLCNDLDNCSYYIKNKKYSKEDYFEEKKKILHNKKEFFKTLLSLNKIGNNFGSTNIMGSYITNSENVENGYYILDMKNLRNVIFVGSTQPGQNIYDTISAGTGGSDDIYGAYSTGISHNIYCSLYTASTSKSYYCHFLADCSYCIGCIGLKNKSFCILNKQYSKEEWYILAEKIFAQMDSDGILGDFFPGSLNPFYFNDTMAYLIDDSFTKEEVEAEGYMWRDDKIKVDIPEGAEVVKTSELRKYEGYNSNGNWFINPDIMKKVIQDENGNIYRIVPMEYDFLIKHQLPLPEIHRLDRIKLGFRFK